MWDEARTLAFWKNLHFKSSAAVGLEIKKIQLSEHASYHNVHRMLMRCFSMTTKSICSVHWLFAWYMKYETNLLAGSFWRHRAISFLKDLPYFLTISLSSTPVSRVGGSFCKVSIKTWTDRKTHSQNQPCNSIADATKKMWLESSPTTFFVAEIQTRRLLAEKNLMWNKSKVLP